MSDGPKQYQIEIAIRYDIRSDWATVKEQVIQQAQRQWRAHRQEVRDAEDAASKSVFHVKRRSDG